MGPTGSGSWVPSGEAAQSAYQAGRHDQLMDLALMTPEERAKVLSEARHPSTADFEQGQADARAGVYRPPLAMAPWDQPEAPIGLAAQLRNLATDLEAAQWAGPGAAWVRQAADLLEVQ